MEFFERQWFTYRTIVNHNLIEHGPPGVAPPRMLDLGCGDLALLAPLLQRLPLGSYTGLDLAAAVLSRAQPALGPVPNPCNWQQADLQSWIQAEGPAIDILHSAFAIHHLNEAEKETCLRAARRGSSSGPMCSANRARRSLPTSSATSAGCVTGRFSAPSSRPRRSIT